MIRTFTPSSASKSAAAAAMRSAIAADAEISGIRDEATRKMPLTQAIEEYAAGLNNLELDETPQDFRNAIALHRQAWLKIGVYLQDFSELRGEMHDVFDEVRADSNPTREEFLNLEKALFDTWAEVETALEKHAA